MNTFFKLPFSDSLGGDCLQLWQFTFTRSEDSTFQVAFDPKTLLLLITSQTIVNNPKLELSLQITRQNGQEVELINFEFTYKAQSPDEEVEEETTEESDESQSELDIEFNALESLDFSFLFEGTVSQEFSANATSQREAEPFSITSVNELGVATIVFSQPLKVPAFKDEGINR